jgi:hypothetical protein
MGSLLDLYICVSNFSTYLCVDFLLDSFGLAIVTSSVVILTKRRLYANLQAISLVLCQSDDSVRWKALHRLEMPSGIEQMNHSICLTFASDYYADITNDQ